MERKLQEINVDLYNNLFTCAVGIGLVNKHLPKIELSKVFLIFPLISHQELLKSLVHKRYKVKSIEQLITDRPTYFSNFNARYSDFLPTTLNAIQYLHETEYIQIDNGSLVQRKTLNYQESMGIRAQKFEAAADKVALLLNSDASQLYLNLRIEL